MTTRPVHPGGLTAEFEKTSRNPTAREAAQRETRGAGADMSRAARRIYSCPAGFPAGRQRGLEPAALKCGGKRGKRGDGRKEGIMRLALTD
jgi:hypothetical protein